MRCVQGEQAPSGRRWAGIAVGLVAAALVLAILALARGEDLTNALDDLVAPLLAAGAGAALAAWRIVRARELQARREAESLQSALGERDRELAAVREETRAELAKRDEAIQRERARRADVERARETERRWRRELRNEVAGLNRECGVLGSRDDVPSLVLRTAVMLVGAQKGLLLSRLDEDSDGDLDLLATEGFENDPEHSNVAQRFAQEVISSDATVREDDPTMPDGGTAADREIENLLAIPIYIHDRFSGVVVCANKPGGFEDDDDEVLLALGDHAGAALHNARLHAELRSAYLSTVAMLAAAVEAKDPFLRTHSGDVTRYVSGVAHALGLGRREREDVIFGSLLHDVGKIGISERILLKPGPLTKQERSLIELHPRIGYQIVRQVPALEGVAPAVLHHHERFDGDGYPSRLTGDEIPLAARIVAVVDAFSAMTTDRPYRQGRSVDEAIAELERCAGTQFDPKIVRLFVDEVRRGPQRGDTAELLVAAIADAEIATRRHEGEPVLGFASFAVTDNLTLLYSHRRFCELVNAEVERAAVQAKPFSVVLAEVADIAELNREHGFGAGDEAIRTLARAVQLVGARVGGTACRFSGATIGLVAGATTEREAEELGEAILRELANGTNTRLGIAVWRPGESGEDVISRARATVRERALVG